MFTLEKRTGGNAPFGRGSCSCFSKGMPVPPKSVAVSAPLLLGIMCECYYTIHKPLTIVFADNLRALRRRRVTSIKKAASELGVTQSTWSQWESGKRFTPGLFFELMAAYFQVPPCRFLALNPERCFQREILS